MSKMGIPLLCITTCMDLPSPHILIIWNKQIVPTVEPELTIYSESCWQRLETVTASPYSVVYYDL